MLGRPPLVTQTPGRDGSLVGRFSYAPWAASMASALLSNDLASVFVASIGELLEPSGGVYPEWTQSQRGELYQAYVSARGAIADTDVLLKVANADGFRVFRQRL
jgi:hypothetical protein